MNPAAACGLAPLVFLPGAGTALYCGLGVMVLFTMLTSVTFLPALLASVLLSSERRPKEAD